MSISFIGRDVSDPFRSMDGPDTDLAITRRRKADQVGQKCQETGQELGPRQKVAYYDTCLYHEPL